MADCSYSRCVQQRRNIKRELQKWTKNMVYIVGLERIAEELMGRRKWKLYQESISRSPLQQNHMINHHLLNKNHEAVAAAAAVIVKKEEVKEEKQIEDVKNNVNINNTVTKAESQPQIKANGQKDVITKEEVIDWEEQERLKDWSPQSKCYFCVDGKLDSDHNHHGASSPRPSESDTSDSPSDSEAPPTLTPNPLSSFLNNNNGGNKAAMTAMESVQSMATLAAALGGATAAGAPPGTVPAFPYPHIFPPAYLNLLRSFPQFAAQERITETPVPEKTGTHTDQPLDLSSKNSGPDGKITPVPKLPGLDTKQIYKAKPRMTQMAGRRTYTEEELQAALRDIQSGKLGTRRAAVIYGIPRSTLRNKVYKLAMERERESHLNPAVIDDDPMEDDKELSGAEEEKEVEKALQAPLLSMADILRFSSGAEVPDAIKAMLLQRAGKEGDIWAGLEHSAVGPYIQNLIIANQQQQKPEEFVLPEIMRKIIAEEQHLNNGDTIEKCPQTQPSPSNSVKNIKLESDMDTEESSSNVILKIPSFKPTTSKNGDTIFNPAVVSPPVTSESSGSPPIMPASMLSLREAISKSIIEKFQQPEPHKIPSVEIDFKRFTPPLGGPIPVIKNHQDMPQKTFPPQLNKTPQNQNSNNNNNNNANNNSNSSGGKGTRPKRGKYRNYDRDSLVEAVRAVQRGEMSVHRAGSYYGVPHSTLEYKVKERHLMRPRKRDPKPNPVDEKIASLKQQDMARNNIPDKLKPANIKPPQKFPPTSPNGIKMPMFDPAMTTLGYTTPPFPFWPHPSFPHIQLDYPRNPSTSQFSPNPDFYASQMMQRLQEENKNHPANPANNSQPALAKSAREMAESLYDGSGANGSFLDGIIRSSLESGVPNDKNKEEKGTTPENMSNKALIDQLCRNSKITPLPKASVEPNSSGDECYKKCTSPGSYGTKNSNDTDSPIALNLGKDDSSKYNKNNDDIQTVDLSNDSDNSMTENGRHKEDGDQQVHQTKSPPSRIYVKPQFQEVTKPENLKPEILLRFRDNMLEEREISRDKIERNGSVCSESAIGSASEDMVQD